MSQQESKSISLPTLCELYGKDSSQMRKMVDKLGIKKTKVRRASDNKLVTIISDEDHQMLVDFYPNLTSKDAGKSFIAVAEACEKLGYKPDQMSNFTRACASYGMELHKRKFDGRTQSCVTKKDFNKFMKIRNAIAVVDID